MGNGRVSAIMMAGFIFLLADNSKYNALDIEGNDAIIKTGGAFHPQGQKFQYIFP